MPETNGGRTGRPQIKPGPAASAVTTNVQGVIASSEPGLMPPGNPAKVCGHRTREAPPRTAEVDGSAGEPVPVSSSSQSGTGCGSGHGLTSGTGKCGHGR